MCIDMQCAPAFAGVEDDAIAPTVMAGCDDCGRCWFSCGGFDYGAMCPQACAFWVRIPRTCADAPDFCFVTP
jgi:hypothetical protein